MREFGESKWSGDAQLWGRPTKAGELADLELPVAADGKYQVVVYLTKARDYGVVQFSLDGKPLGKPIDCFEPEKVLATGPIDLGTVDLKKGEAVLRVEVTGTNAKSVGVRVHVGPGLRGAQAGSKPRNTRNTRNKTCKRVRLIPCVPCVPWFDFELLRLAAF